MWRFRCAPFTTLYACRLPLDDTVVNTL
jgi:hypothetical protein